MLVGPPAPKYLSQSVPKTSSSSTSENDNFSSKFSSTSSKLTPHPTITYPPIPHKLQPTVYRSKQPISRPATCSDSPEKEKPRELRYHELENLELEILPKLENLPKKRVIPRKIDTKRAGMFNCDD